MDNGQFEDSLADGYTGEQVAPTEIVSAFGTKIKAPPPPIAVPSTKLVDYEEENDDMEDTGFVYNLNATYEVHHDLMSDGYENYDTYEIKLKLESEDPDFIEQPELILNLSQYRVDNDGKLESLLKLIKTVFELGQTNSENYLSIDGKSIETSELEI